MGTDNFNVTMGSFDSCPKYGPSRYIHFRHCRITNQSKIGIHRDYGLNSTSNSNRHITSKIQRKVIRAYIYIYIYMVRNKNQLEHLL